MCVPAMAMKREMKPNERSMMTDAHDTMMAQRTQLLYCASSSGVMGAPCLRWPAIATATHNTR